MKFCQLSDFAPRSDFKVYPLAYLSPEMQGAEFIPDGGKTKGFFKLPEKEAVNNTFFVENAPVFDYFVLKEVYGSSRKKFDWIKLDIYGFVVGHYSLGSCFLVSPKFKEVVSHFRLPKHKFYAAKLLYKGEKLDYYIFQLGELFKPIFDQCTYHIKKLDPTDFRFKDTGIIVPAKELNIKSKEDYYDLRIKYDKENQRIDIEDCVFAEYYDYFNSKELYIVVSESLKEALECAGLTEGISLKDISPRTITFLNQ